MQEARAMLEATKKKKGVLLKDGEKFDKKAIMQVGRGGGGGRESFKGGGGRMPCVQPLMPTGMQHTALCILHAGMSQLMLRVLRVCSRWSVCVLGHQPGCALHLLHTTSNLGMSQLPTATPFQQPAVAATPPPLLRV
jgi:hypothetical protein